MVTISGIDESIAEDRNGYTYWPVPAQSTMHVTIESGDTWSGHHIDVTASGAGFTLGNGTSWGATQPATWTLSDIGLEGENDIGNTPCMAVGCSDEALMENIYLGDGLPDYPNWADRFDYATGILVDRGHTGHLEIKGANIRNWIDNGLYGSPPSLESDGGTLHYQDVYAAYNNNASLRIGRGSVDNCCTVVNEDGGWGLVLRDDGPTTVSDTVAYDEAPNADNSYAVVTLEGGSGDFTNVGYNTGVESGEGPPPTYTGSSYDAVEDDVFLPDLAPEAASNAYTGDPSGGEPGGPGGGTGATFPDRQIPYIRFNDVYLENIEGVAIWGGSVNENAEYIVENVHINEAEVGVLAEGGPVQVTGCEIIADEPTATDNGGGISIEDTNTSRPTPEQPDGGGADPVLPGGAPASPEDAME